MLIMNSPPSSPNPSIFSKEEPKWANPCENAIVFIDRTADL
jgi:hypothetical protein